MHSTPTGEFRSPLEPSVSPFLSACRCSLVFRELCTLVLFLSVGILLRPRPPPPPYFAYRCDLEGEDPVAGTNSASCGDPVGLKRRRGPNGSPPEPDLPSPPDLPQPDCGDELTLLEGSSVQGVLVEIPQHLD